MKSETAQIIKIAKKAMEASGYEREEVRWLQERYLHFCQENHIDKKADADQLLFEKMYAGAPASPAALTKIRFWRTGKHIPANREQASLFAKALNLDEADATYFWQAYLDKSDLVFEKEEDQTSVYRERLAYFEELIREYILKIHPVKRMELGIKDAPLQSQLRHLYFMDTRQYLFSPEQSKTSASPLVSVNYYSEFNRNMKLLGEIPRKTMIRHLIIFMMPFLTVDRLNEALIFLGYLPLSANHRLTTGEALDFLIQQFLLLYEKNCRGCSPEECMDWFLQASRTLDGYLREKNCTNLRFLYFKALNDGE